MSTAPSRVSTRVAVGIAIRCALEGACQGSRSCDNMRMWGARAVRSLNVVLRRFAPSARHRLRALARASRLLSGEQTPILNGVGPHASAPRCSAPLAWSLSFGMARAPCYANDAAPLAHPLPVTPPPLGWATRALDAAAAARAGWVTGVTGVTFASAARTLGTARRFAAR